MRRVVRRGVDVLRAHAAALLRHARAKLQLHEERRTLDERAFYPAHDLRKESAAYARVHRAMVDEEDQPCRICGVRASTLTSRHDNPYGATAMETHHHVIEWALANAVDLEKFQRCVVEPRVVSDPAKYGVRRGGRIVARAFTRSEMLAWIDHDRDNLWVLCDVHHRHRWFGVHAITGPVWEAQRLLRPEVGTFVRGHLPVSDGASHVVP